ncbi:FAD-binding protein (plasmid) [Rhodococcus qingshengii]|uniref:FAD-binding oxidoreductase n=1 Tax=Rhodococcus qingshengii TaxID=334542 RepID=UPI0021121BB1|nr:FAD-linked oxidase C-terminal domain-containing protein [Rhodococcus qingshengii]UUE28836.1 FAD-binding protein [Rhodococcus qingshengii]
MGEFLASVAEKIGHNGVLTDPDIIDTYSRDQSRMTSYVRAAGVVAPSSTEQVSVCLSLAHHHGITLVARGAGSGLSGGANSQAGCVIVSLHRMDRIISIDEANRLAIVQPGVITAALRAEVAQVGLYYPPDPGSVDFCTLGGNIATNAGGLCCVKYGVTGDFVLGLEVVLADGRVLKTGHSTMKGVAGYDLTRLFVGSEGTLGIITEATLRLVPSPKRPHTFVASFATLSAAGRSVTELLRAGITPSMLEILDHTTVRAVDDYTKMGLGEGVHAMVIAQSDEVDAASVVARIDEICCAEGALDTASSDDREEGKMLLEARRLALPALERLGDWILDDVCVPRTKIVELIESIEKIAELEDLTIGVFGHAGDGNLHPTIIYDAKIEASALAAQRAFNAITARALELGGTITGEHGVGKLKVGWLAVEQGEVGVDVHRAVKTALDPCGVLNPSAVLGGV